jgi:hypothetical protein
MSIYILRLYTVVNYDNRDISWDTYEIEDVGYFTGLDILRFNASNTYKNMEIVIDEEEKKERKEEKEIGYFSDHLRVFKKKLDVLL